MTLKNNWAPLLFYLKLCVSSRSHWWIQTGVTVRKRPMWVKFDDFRDLENRWPWKTIGHLFYAISSYVRDSLPYVTSNWSYSPETAQLGFDLCDLDLWPLTLVHILSMVITPENFMMIWWGEHGEKCVTDGQTDRQTDGLNQSYRVAKNWP